MKRLLAILCLLGCYTMTGCADASFAASNKAGPTIDSIRTSTKSFSIDCAPTSVTVTAHITDTAAIGQARLWYRVGSDQPYVSVDMARVGGNDFSATVKGVALPNDKYGDWEFYVTAEDNAGHKSKSALDASVQFLPCVAH